MFDEIKKGLGEAADGLAHGVGDALSDLGMTETGKAVSQAGDDVADGLGAVVAEQELGQTNNPTDLVHGDPAKISGAATTMRGMATTTGQVADGLHALDTSEWKGQAGDSFRESYAPAPKLWDQIHQAYTVAAKTLADFAATVTWAQGQAKTALELYQRGRQASDQARAQHNDAVNRYNSAANAANEALAHGQQPPPVPPMPGQFSDPGAGDMRNAQAILTQARRQRDAAGDDAGHALQQASSVFPKVSGAERAMLENFGLPTAGDIAVEHAVGGAIRGVGSGLKFARSLNPMDPYNASHPFDYMQGMSTTAAGLVHMADHPDQFVEGMAGDGWSKDPADALGTLASNFINPEDLAAGGARSIARGATHEAEHATEHVTEHAGIPDHSGTQAEPRPEPQQPSPADSQPPRTPLARALSPEPQLGGQATAAVDHSLDQVEHELDSLHMHDPGGTQPTGHEAAPNPEHEPPSSGPDRGEGLTSPRQEPTSPAATPEVGASPPHIPAASVDRAAAQTVDNAGSGLGRAERELRDIEAHAPAQDVGPQRGPSVDDPYLQPNGTLKNKLGIDNAFELAQAERMVSTKARAKLLKRGLPDVTKTGALDMLKEIHKSLFNEVYDWAGEIRDITMRKVGSPHGFLNHSEIEDAPPVIDGYLQRNKFLEGLNDDEFAEKMARTWATLNYIHPFREGNGRTVRMYLDILAQHTGRTISWDDLPSEVNADVSRKSTPNGENNIEPMTEALKRIIHRIDTPPTSGERP